MKILKWFFILLVIFIVLSVAGVSILLSRFDPNDYKTQIAEQVEKKIGRTLDISGDIKWSIFPRIGLSLGQTALENAEGFGAAPFASIKEANVYVAVMPLLKKQIKVSTVKLSGVKLNLQKNTAGVDNWSDLAGSGDDKELSTKPVTDSSTAVSNIDLSIDGLIFEKATLSYTDAQTGTTIIIDPLNVKTGALIMGKAMPVDVDLKLIMDGLEIEAETSGNLIMDMDSKQLHIDSQIKAKIVQKQESGAINMQLKGKLVADPLQGEFQFSGLNIDAVISGDQYPGGSLEAKVRADLKANTNTQLANIAGLVLEFSDIELKGDLKATQFIDAPNYTGHLSSNDFNPAKVMLAIGIQPPQTTENKAFSHANLKMGLSGNTSSVSIKPLEATFDQSSLNGEIKIENFKKMALRYDLTIDQFNADHYLPPVTEEKGKQVAVSAGVASSGSSSTSAGTNSDSIVLPVDTIRSLDVAGTARINALTIHELLFQNASLTLKANGGKVNIKPLSADMYQGKAVINASLDVNSAKPGYKTDIALKGVRSEDILTTLFNDPYVSGSTNFNADIATQGDTVSGLKQNLGGNWKAKFSEGTIYGSKLAAKINQAQNALRKLQGKPPLDDKTPNETEFSLFTASGDIKQGVVNNNDMKVIAPQFQVKGAGRVELPASKLDYTVSISRPDEESTDRLYLPLRVYGAFSDLKFTLKLDALAKQRLNIETDKIKLEAKQKLDATKEKTKAELEQKKEEKEAELKEKLKKEEDKLKEKLKKGLGDLFN